MIVPAMVLLLAPGGPQALFEASVRAHRQTSTFSVHIESDSSIPGKKERTQFDFSMKGSNSLLRMREAATGGFDKSDRTILVQKDRVTGYDAIANESLRRTGKFNGSVTERLSGILGQLPDCLTLILDPNVMALFFNKFAGFKDWDLTRNGSVITLLRRSKGTETMFRFIGAHPLVSEVSIKLKDSRLHWTYTYKPTGALALKIPVDANNVYSFTLRAAPPKFASKAAEQVIQKMTRAYAGLKNGQIEVSGREGQSTLLLGGKKLREDRPGFVWTYDGSVLSILNRRTHKFYKGKTIRVTLSEYVVAAGAEVDPIIRRIIAHRVPFGDLFPTSAKVKISGTVNLGSGPSDIVQVTGTSPRSSIFVRKDTHLLESIESETIDERGKVQSKGMRQFKYLHLGIPPAAAKFQINPSGYRALPLPKLKLNQDTPSRK